MTAQLLRQQRGSTPTSDSRIARPAAGDVCLMTGQNLRMLPVGDAFLSLNRKRGPKSTYTIFDELSLVWCIRGERLRGLMLLD